HAWRPRNPTPWMLRKETARTIVTPIVSNARSVPESRATKFEATRRAAAPSHGASALTATRWRRTSQTAAVTSPVVQRSALSPHGTARNSASPATPKPAPAARISRPSRVLPLTALIRRRFRQPAEAALPRVKLGDRRGELRRPEVGPHRFGEIQLCVRALP